MDVRPRRFVLKNGLTVLAAVDDAVPVACVSVWYGVGSRNESPGTTGASHFVEHMLFKGGKRFDKDAMWRVVSRVGGEENGFTDHDFTAYYETVPASSWELALEIERDRMADAAFDPGEVEAERTVILSERDGIEDQPDAALGERVRDAAFAAHPYRWDSIGRAEDIAGVTRDALLAYYRTHYVPRRTAISIAGAVDPDAAIARAEGLFGDLPPGAREPDVGPEEPPQDRARFVELRRAGATAYLATAHHIPPVTHADHPALRVLEALLSGARSFGLAPHTFGQRTSILYRDLVLSGLATDVSVAAEGMLDPGLMWMCAVVSHGVAIEAVEDAIDRAIRAIADRGPDGEALERARRAVRMAEADSLDGATSLSLSFGWAERCGGVELLERLRAGVQTVSAADVIRVARAYLRPENRTTGRFIPEEAGRDG
ncbi:MAG: insulinase family protein [Planctomycetes bacterium]|nr:insulinase family protein [Planctomycetota bacterium]